MLPLSPDSRPLVSALPHVGGRALSVPHTRCQTYPSKTAHSETVGSASLRLQHDEPTYTSYVPVHSEAVHEEDVYGNVYAYAYRSPQGPHATERTQTLER